MTKHVFAIFAHPDDEAFGPCGTLLTEVANGSALHLIMLTAGEAGMNPDNHSDLGSVRLQEWHRAGDLLGASSRHYLNYRDGYLANSDMLTVQRTISEIITAALEAQPDHTTAEIITNDLNGITGHIDHIVAARAASYAFYTLKQCGAPLTRIRYACVPYERWPQPNTDWLFRQPGRKESAITEVVDGRAHRDKIINIMHAHHTQRSDAKTHLEERGEALGLDHFIVQV